MFRKSAPVEEIKPLPKTKAEGGDDALSFFGLNAPETPTGASGNAPAPQASGCPSAKHEPRSVHTMLETSDGEHSITLCHYPMITFNHCIAGREQQNL